MSLTQDRLQQIYRYDEATGMFTRIARTGDSIPLGLVRVKPNGNGYLRLCVDYVLYQQHRLAWLYCYGEWPQKMLDHINGVKTDNRIANLREANNSLNGLNSRNPRRNNQCGVLGVFETKCGTFQASIQVDGTPRYLGVHKTIEAARDAYLAAKKRLSPEAIKQEHQQ